MALEKLVETTKEQTAKLAHGAEQAFEAAKAVERAAENALMSTPAVSPAPGASPGATPPSSGSRLTDFGSRRVREITDELHEAIPTIEEAGYALSAMDIDIGVPPKLVAHFILTEEIDESRRQALLERTRSSRALHVLLSSLFRASDLQRAVRVGALTFRGIEVHISAMPKVRLVFCRSIAELPGLRAARLGGDPA